MILILACQADKISEEFAYEELTRLDSEFWKQADELTKIFFEEEERLSNEYYTDPLVSKFITVLLDEQNKREGKIDLTPVGEDERRRILAEESIEEKEILNKEKEVEGALVDNYNRGHDMPYISDDNKREDYRHDKYRKERDIFYRDTNISLRVWRDKFERRRQVIWALSKFHD